MEPSTKDIGKIFSMAAGVQAATADDATAPAVRPVSVFLSQVREALRMDIAFVSKIDAGRRAFQVVSASGSSDLAIEAGHSDPLMDTYCKLVVDGDLPAVVPDVRDIPSIAGLPITGRLRIRSYLSAPIVLWSGDIYGTVCCFSHSARPDLREADADALKAIAAAIAAHIDKRGSIEGLAWS
ncbi:MAG TPA: GAF domain-containing protein [Ramlibacter sp.]|jgi:GAF domain-containing protein|uniref:GAF domain-containing protein n=1 Tax=Ramlibacter sp. TaxID=1917967 RepID=UPI002D3B7E27|nr:GAF domain-containing protein [Ramlibacter sp.]HZY19850.1 GAF domain-containing protein [Ramlibacter sp.]